LGKATAMKDEASERRRAHPNLARAWLVRQLLPPERPVRRSRFTLLTFEAGDATLSFGSAFTLSPPLTLNPGYTGGARRAFKASSKAEASSKCGHSDCDFMHENSPEHRGINEAKALISSPKLESHDCRRLKRNIQGNNAPWHCHTVDGHQADKSKCESRRQYRHSVSAVWRASFGPTIVEAMHDHFSTRRYAKQWGD
jgi:hypothetical protein